MSSYAALADVQKLVDDVELVQLTDDTGAGTVDTTLVADQLTLASAEIEGYLGARYDLPLATPPTILTILCVNIAVFNMYSRRQGPPDHWQDRYENTISFLSSVAKGSISLGAGDPDGNATGSTPQVTGPTRIFSRDKLSGF